MFSLTELLIRNAGTYNASAVNRNRRLISNVFVPHPARLLTPLDVGRTVAHRCHDERVDVDQVDAGRRTVFTLASVVIDVLCLSSVHKREAAHISIGDRGASVQCVAGSKWCPPRQIYYGYFCRRVSCDKTNCYHLTCTIIFCFGKTETKPKKYFVLE